MSHVSGKRLRCNNKYAGRVHHFGHMIEVHTPLAPGDAAPGLVSPGLPGEPGLVAGLPWAPGLPTVPAFGDSVPGLPAAPFLGDWDAVCNA